MFQHQIKLFLIVLFFSNNVFAATDSYRWLHVTIDTPWAIFLFLLPMILLPVVLMALLYWKFAGKETATSKWTKSQNELSNKK